MSYAFCTARHCDPKQCSAKGQHKPHAVTGVQKCPDCGGMLVWYESKTKYRHGNAFPGRYLRERREEIERNILTITAS